MLTNMLHYAEKQVEINKTLERVYSRCQITRPKKKRYRLRKIHNLSTTQYEQ
jgi:hypothetical protein